MVFFFNWFLVPQDNTSKGLMVVGAGCALSFLAFALTRYKRCSPNEVLVVFGQVGKGGGVTGTGKTAFNGKLVHGGGTIVWPIIQDYRQLSLEPFAIEIPLHKALSKEKVRVNVPSVFTLAVGDDPEILEKAALRLLDMEPEDIEHQANEIITGQLRQVIASMSIDEINADREKFESTIRRHSEKELNKIGLCLINVNITNIEDDSGLIEAMGKKATAEVVQKAMVDVAIAERHGAIGQAEQERDKQIGVAKNQQESTVKTAEYSALQVSGENKAKQSIASSNSELQVAEAEAYQIGEIKQRQAHAAVLEAESAALASAALAEAHKIEAEKRSELEAPAKAMKAKIIVDSEAQAEQSRIQAEGEAQASFLKYEAEARGNYELLARKAEGLGMIVKETGGADDAFRLLMVDNIPKLAESSAKAISNIKFDKIVVWDGGGNGGGNGSGDGDAGTATSNFIRGLTNSLPPSADVLRSVGGIDGLDKILLSGSKSGGAGPHMSELATPENLAKVKELLGEAEIVEGKGEEKR